MKMNRLVVLATALVVVAGLTSCKTSGMAMTSRGQLFKISISAPNRLPEGGEGNINVVLSNRGVNDVSNILADVEFPPQLAVLDQINPNGVMVMHNPGTNVWHFQVPKLHPAEDATLRFHVRTTFGTLQQTGQISVTAYQSDLPGNKLFRKTTINLQP